MHAVPIFYIDAGKRTKKLTKAGSDAFPESTLQTKPFAILYC